MKLRSAQTIISIAVALCGVPLFAAKPTALDIMKKIDSMSELTSDANAKVTIIQQRATQGVKQIEMEWYRRDKDDSILLIFTAPETDKGNGFLRVGDDMWFYRKNTRTFQHVNRDESIGGSDARAGDFEERKLVELYKPQNDTNGVEVAEETLGKSALPVYKITLIAKVNDVTYPKLVIWVERDTLLERKRESYSLSGTLMATGYFRKYTTVNGKYVPVETTYIDEFEKGNVSGVKITEIQTLKIPDSVFTKAYLENLSK